MRIAVIPARAGSKRIPRKNIKLFCGSPMIAWTIKAARECGVLDQIVVSTDDDEIAEVARALGAEVPFSRPPHLSDDYTGTSPVVAHAIQWYQANGYCIDLACCIYATAPFLRPDDMKRGLELITGAGAEFAFSVTSYAFPIQRAIKLNSQGRVEMFQPQYLDTRSQDLEVAYHDAGQFYWGRAEAWISNKSIFSVDSVPVILPRYRVQDIDTEEDWERAEWMFKALGLD